MENPPSQIAQRKSLLAPLLAKPKVLPLSECKSWLTNNAMTTTVTTKNMISIPSELARMFQIPTIIIIDYLYMSQLKAYLQKDLSNLRKCKVRKLILRELPFSHPILWRYYPNHRISQDLGHPEQIWHKKLYWNDRALLNLLLPVLQLVLLFIHHKL